MVRICNYVLTRIDLESRTCIAVVGRSVYDVFHQFDRASSGPNQSNLVTARASEAIF